MVKSYVKYELKIILKHAKNGNEYGVRLWVDELDGALRYMLYKGDISLEDRQRINKLVVMIKKRYGMF